MGSLAQLWNIYISTPLGTSKQIREQRLLQQSYLKVRSDLAATSSQDEFAKWAKLRRQHDKMLEELEKKSRFCLLKPHPALGFSLDSSLRNWHMYIDKYFSRIRHRYHPRFLRQDRHRRPLVQHIRRPLDYSHVVRTRAHVLAAPRLVPLLRRMDHLVPPRTSGKRQRGFLAVGLHGRGRAGVGYPGRDFEAGAGREAGICIEAEGAAGQELITGTERDKGTGTTSTG